MLFISPQKLFLFTRYLNWCLDFLVMYRKGLIKKMKVNFKFYDVTAWLKNNCNTHIAQILKSKGNQTMTFAQLIEYNWRTIFLEKSCTKCGRENGPRPFSGKLKLSISLDQWSKNLVSFYCIPS